MGEWTAALLGPFLLIAVLVCAAAVITLVIRARRRGRPTDDPAHRSYGLSPGPERDARFRRPERHVPDDQQE